MLHLFLRFASHSFKPSIDQVERRLLVLSAVFLALFSSALTLSPAVRARSWEVNYRWNHWLGFFAWLIAMCVLHRLIMHYLPDRDPYLFPIAALLSGWGILTVWRLYPSYGIRQTIWLWVSSGVVALGLCQSSLLNLLRRYKYLWLSTGLLLTALTLFLGTNPGGSSGPHLWLGCCGVYFQPSEPLKLLWIVYLAAYLSDRQANLAITLQKDSANKYSRTALFSYLAPTVCMTGLVLLLLFVQRDLGTVSIFVLLYACVVYIATQRVQVLVANIALLLIAGLVGYYAFDVVRLRVEAWLNPWLDPSGRSYQIVQSVLAIANGGIFGRGPGVGNPTLVPIPHSDSIFTAIAEENGLIGVIALLTLLALFLCRGLRTAMQASNRFQYYLACGLTTYLVIQSVLIIGGNTRLLPLTGVTLPFISYGGTSLLTAWLALLLLLCISNREENAPPLHVDFRPLIWINTSLLGALTCLAITAGWWSVYRAPKLLERTDNARRAIAEQYVKRGSILDRRGSTLAITHGEPGTYTRIYPYPPLGPVIGYDHPVYGQHGVEAALDPYLRGLEGYPIWIIAWNHLLYGTPPKGLDVRLTLDLNLQQLADQLLGDHHGALVLINAQSGDVLAMASHPTFDPNQIERDWARLVEDKQTPLLNRAVQGRYRVGTSLGAFLLAATMESGQLPDPQPLLEETNLGCALKPTALNWGNAIAAGCSKPALLLGEVLGKERIWQLYKDLGLFTPPSFGLSGENIRTLEELQTPEHSSLDFSAPAMESTLQVSPMQIALAAATLSNQGTRPASRLVIAVKTPQSEWTILPTQEHSTTVFTPEAALTAVEAFALQDLPIWQSIAIVSDQGYNALTWYLGGTLPTWQGAPLALVIVLEERDVEAIVTIGQTMLATTMQLSQMP